MVESLRVGLNNTALHDRIVYVNSRISELTGHRPEDLDGKQAQELLFDTANWKEGDSRMTARRERKRTCYDAPLLDKEGKVLQVEVFAELEQIISPGSVRFWRKEMSRLVEYRIEQRRESHARHRKTPHDHGDILVEVV